MKLQYANNEYYLLDTNSLVTMVTYSLGKSGTLYLPITSLWGTIKEDCNVILASTQVLVGLPMLDKSKILSMLGEPDVNKLSEQHADSKWLREEILWTARKFGFKEGYNQSLRDNSKKEFTIKDMREAIAEAWNSCEENEDEETFSQVLDRILETLKKKTLWDVEIEMEMATASALLSGYERKPKLTKGYINVLSIK